MIMGKFFPGLFWFGLEAREPSDNAETSGTGDGTFGSAAESTKRLSLDIPRSLHKRFKMACTATDRKMVTELQTFIEHRTEELENEAGIHRK